jgi:hypothetical protein
MKFALVRMKYGSGSSEMRGLGATLSQFTIVHGRILIPSYYALAERGF